MPSATTDLRPAALAVLLVATVAATAAALYLFWPAGVVMGIGLGVLTSVVVGVRMQFANRMVPRDEDLARRLGVAREAKRAIAPAATTATVTARVAAVVPERMAPTAAPELQPLPDILYFEEGDARVAALADAESEGLAAAGDGGAVRADLEQLKDELGDDYRDFARAARLVVSTQYASAARLQRDLDLPYSRARRLLGDLEARHFVGPATGSLPRVVLMPKDRLPEIERLLAV